MTTQIPDQIALDGELFDLTFVNGTGLFDPADHGLPRPEPISTMCFSGLVCRYAIENGQLLLRELEFGSSNEPPVLGGVRARESNCAWCYEGLAVPVGFTGRFLAAARWLKDSPDLHLGFSPAWMYETVAELAFSGGNLTEIRDRSAELAAVRARIRAALQPGGNGPDRRESPAHWYIRAFTPGEFDYSWPQ